MSAEWRETTLGEVVNLKRGFDLPANSRIQGSIPIISSSGISGFHAEAKVKSPGVVTGRYGTIGTVHYYEGEFWPLNTTLFVEDFKGNDPKFVYYFLKTIDYQQFSDKGAVPGVNRNHLHTARVLVPDVDTQKEIALSLGALDGKIALLRETNATLEAIAQALFKSWFVEFDPVRAKMDGREPEGMDAETAALFPDSFEDSELGEIPRGWAVSKVGDVIQIVGGGTPSTKETGYWEPAKYHWVTPKDLSGISAPVLLDTERKLSELGIKKVSSGLLPEQTLLLSSRAPIGYLAIAKIPTAINQGFIAILPHADYGPEFWLLWCRQNMEAIKQKSNGSTFMEISKTAFRTIPMVVPPATVAHAFTEIALPIYQRIAENESQARSLADLRDTLLPRLMSGKLLVPSNTITEEETA